MVCLSVNSFHLVQWVNFENEGNGMCFSQLFTPGPVGSLSDWKSNGICLSHLFTPGPVGSVLDRDSNGTSLSQLFPPGPVGSF